MNEVRNLIMSNVNGLVMSLEGLMLHILDPDPQFCALSNLKVVLSYGV